jgi:hypothetical protein
MAREGSVHGSFSRAIVYKQFDATGVTRVDSLAPKR